MRGFRPWVGVRHGEGEGGDLELLKNTSIHFNVGYNIKIIFSNAMEGPQYIAGSVFQTKLGCPD